MTTETYTILMEKKTDVEKKLKKYAKKAQKYGIPFSFSFADPYCIDIERTDDFGKKYTEKYEVCDLTIESEVIRKDGYEIIARLEHSHTGNIVNVFVGEMRNEWATMHAHCDHCNGDHGQKVTFIVSNGIEEKQVGRTCLMDYCGIDPQAVGMMNQFTDEIEEFTADGYDFHEHIPIVYDTVDVLAHAVDVYTEQGYVKSEERNSNKGEIMKRFYGNDNPTKEGMAKAHEMAKAIAEMDIDEAIDAKLNNVQVRIKSYYCKPTDFGYIACAPLFFDRWEQRKANIERRAKEAEKMASVSEYVGTVGERIETEVKEVKLLTSFPTNYGMTFLYRFIDENDNVLVWFASSPMEEHENVKRIKATIKAHSERDGVKQTILSRVKEISKTSKNISKSA